MSGVEIGKALLKLSPNGLRGMVSTLPPGAIAQFMSFHPSIKTIHGNSNELLKFQFG